MIPVQLDFQWNLLLACFMFNEAQINLLRWRLSGEWVSNRSYGSIVVYVKTFTMQRYPPNLMFNNNSTDYFLCGIQMEPYNLLDIQQMTSRLKDHPLSTLNFCQISLPLWATHPCFEQTPHTRMLQMMKFCKYNHFLLNLWNTQLIYPFFP